MYDKLIKKHLEANSVNEESVPGVKTTDATKKDEAKVNKDYYKDVEKKMSDYNAASTKKDKDGINAPKNKLSKKEEEIMQDIEMGGGMQDLTYHNEPDERFKERQEMAIKGDSKMGNKIYTGKENGNTESTWGASDDELGEKIIKRTKRRQEKIDAAADNLTSFGDDIEFNPNKTLKKNKVAVENRENNNNKLTETSKMKRLRFKSAFNGMENALNLIPEGYKEDNKVFEMTDGNETYKVRWEGNLTEGKAVVLLAANQEVIKEDMNKIFHLMNYNSEKTLGTVKGKDRIQENAKFSEIWDKAKRIIKEDIDKENDELSVMAKEYGITRDNLIKTIDVCELYNLIDESKDPFYLVSQFSYDDLVGAFRCENKDPDKIINVLLSSQKYLKHLLENKVSPEDDSVYAIDIESLLWFSKSPINIVRKLGEKNTNKLINDIDSVGIDFLLKNARNKEQTNAIIMRALSTNHSTGKTPWDI